MHINRKLNKSKENNKNIFTKKNTNKRIALSGASLPKGNRRLRGLREEPCRAWNSFGNNIEKYATTNETDFMGSVTMSPASGRQKTQKIYHQQFQALQSSIIMTPTLAGGCLGCVCVTYLDLKLLTKSTNKTQKSGIIPKLKDFYNLKLDRFVDYYHFFLNE